MATNWEKEFVYLQEVEGHGLCGIKNLLFTVGLFTNLKLYDNYYDFDGRYCYPHAHGNGVDAVADLVRGWPQGTHPPGNWIKYKGTKESEFTNPNYKK